MNDMRVMVSSARMYGLRTLSLRIDNVANGGIVSVKCARLAFLSNGFEKIGTLSLNGLVHYR